MSRLLVVLIGARTDNSFVKTVNLGEIRYQLYLYKFFLVAGFSGKRPPNPQSNQNMDVTTKMFDSNLLSQKSRDTIHLQAHI